MRPIFSVARFLLVAVVAVAMASCSPSGGGTTTSVTSAGGGTALTSFTIVIPLGTVAASSVRRAQYVSANSKSIGVTITNGVSTTGPTYFSLSGAGCTTASNVTTCTYQMAAPVGTDAFAFTLYSDTYTTGGAAPSTPLSTANVPNQVIQVGVANQIGTFTLNPIIGSMQIAVSQPVGGFTVGSASNGAVNLTVKDASGATIIAPGVYVNASDTTTPIGLTSSQTPFTFALDGGTAASTGTLNGPSDTAILDYSGIGLTGTTTITAAAAGVTSATQVLPATGVDPIVATLSSSASGSQYHITTSPAELDFYASGITGTIALAETGYAGTFTLASSTCSSSFVTLSPGVGQTGSSFTIGAVSGGTTGNKAICSATFTDTNGQSLSATFTVTTISYSFQ
jgi:hypothetical protein